MSLELRVIVNKQIEKWVDSSTSNSMNNEDKQFRSYRMKTTKTDNWFAQENYGQPTHVKLLTGP